ncbi:winged helix-turn-helix transcriptional regulator [Actinocrinis puniceicyclus]|uniref:Winged helix-turn-helix transcriptional regulator n=1 Tax=Actinocrinis puniceicyclus TaxID=977794 RepID=A0A8J7WL53_9ACTN|nr:winged helix-turn-helix domain-containing protein [Actinocrinis puniceicyclus]MBS2963318.1 winged helix-turn-helix transcriptional regulator [Actinocrinis puniceicyclus]
MKNGGPTLLPLLRSRTQGALLALLYLHPDDEYSLTHVARLVGVSVASVHHEAERLVEAGYLLERRQGNVRLIRAATDTIVARPLTDLLAVTYGPRPVLADALRGVAGISEAVIFGSWAARYRGEPGPIPADVDVLVIGDADLDDLDAAAAAASRALHRPVNIQRVRPAAWAEDPPTDPFLTSVRERPRVRLLPEGSE